MAFPQQTATNAQRYMYSVTIETPGDSSVGIDKRRRSAPSTTRMIKAAIFDVPGSRTRTDAPDHLAGQRQITVFTMAQPHLATGSAPVREGELVLWLGDKYEIWEARRWAGGDHSAPTENPKTFFECVASRVVAR